MSKIYDLPLLYRIVRKYVNFSFKRFYSKYTVVGKENIPAEGPVIFAPNHRNALMDALAVITITPKNYSTIFLARSDIFKNKFIARLLQFGKLMPAFRIRDGIENLGKNGEVFEQCIEVLENKNAVCIMPEGNQEIEKKVRSFGKGIFRIAFSAQQKLGSAKSVKIIPVGIDYGDIMKYGKHIIINVGKPIDVAEYMDEYNENPVNATNKIRYRLKNDIEHLVLHLDTEKHYTAFETATQIANLPMLEKLQLDNNTVNLFYARQKIGRELIELKQKQPNIAEKLNDFCAEFETLRQHLRLHIRNFDKQSQKPLSIIIQGLLLTLLSPVFLIGFTLNFLPFFAPVFIRKMMKVEFTGFFSSIQYTAGALITFPVFYILQAILFLAITNFSWWLMLLFIPLEYILGKWALGWYKQIRKWIGNINHRKVRKNEQKKYNELVTLREEILEIILK